MGFLDKFKPVGKGVVTTQPAVSRPLEMQWRWLPSGQVVWYAGDGESMIENYYLGNHIVWSVENWKASKVASAPWYLYKVKDEKSYRKLSILMKDFDPRNIQQIKELRTKALVEIDDHEILKVLQNPNPYMSAYEFFYGHTVYKDIVGSSYLMAVRNGIDDPTEGKITELWLPPAHQMVIVSGGVYNPIESYYLNSNPEKRIHAKNVCQIRHFSPRHQTPFQSLYGMSRIFPAKNLIQTYNEGVATSASVFQTKGVRDIVFPKGINDIGSIPIEQAQAAQDRMNQKLSNSGQGGIIANNVELGSIRVGFSPSELGILESQKDAKTDICALYGVSPIIFDWNDRSTYNNKAEARKMSLTDAVIPELEILKDALNNWLLPSYSKERNLLIDYDPTFFAELQEDKAEQLKWMNLAPLTNNEKREILGYERSNDLNADKVMVPSNMALLESLGVDGFDPASQEVVDDTFGQDTGNE